MKALLRIAVVYDIPIANNLATADFMLNSSYMKTSYQRKIENFNQIYQKRVEEMKINEEFPTEHFTEISKNAQKSLQNVLWGFYEYGKIREDSRVVL